MATELIVGRSAWRRAVFLLLLFAPLVRGAETAAPLAVTTYECAGLYWSRPEAGTCKVRYRVAGAGDWREALALAYDARDGEYRGSLVGLTPDTAYEAELSADGDVKAALSFRTRSDRFPIGRITRLPAGEGRLPVVITDSGTPDGYHLVTGPEGAKTTLDLGNAAPHGIVIDADYVVVRGIEVRNAGMHGILIRAGRHDVVVEGCRVTFWGRMGGPYSHGNREGELDSGIYAEKGTANLTLQRNLIEHPRGASNDWDTGHPAGPQGISLIESRGGNVIRYNEIWSTEAHGFNDVIGGAENFSNAGNVNRDSDIHGNILRNAWDDAIEVEGANMNVRVWGNYLQHYFIGIGTAATAKGPLYIFRNVFGESRRTQSDRIGGNMIKTGDRPGFGGGRRYVFHNTALQPGGVLNIFSAATANCVSRNNIFDCAGRLLPRSDRQPVGDHDYDLFSGAERGAAELRHGVRGRPAYVAAYGLEFYPASTSTRVVFGRVLWEFGERKGAVGDPVVRVANPVIDAGVVLSGFNDGFTGRAPDLGAFEVATPPLQFGRRAYCTPGEGWAPWERY